RALGLDALHDLVAHGVYELDGLLLIEAGELDREGPEAEQWCGGGAPHDVGLVDLLRLGDGAVRSRAHGQRDLVSGQTVVEGERVVRLRLVLGQRDLYLEAARREE